MATIPLPTNDSAAVRGVRTGIQTIIGALVAFTIGLWLVIWHVPGVSDAVINYVYANLPQTLLALGVPAGLTSFVWNALRSDVKNW